VSIPDEDSWYLRPGLKASRASGWKRGCALIPAALLVLMAIATIVVVAIVAISQ
jgi:hypothetical protein